MWLGSYVDGNLFLILFNKERNEIEWCEVDGVNILVSKTYKVPFDLAFYLKRSSQLEFFNEAGLTDTFKGSAKIKLFRYATDLYLVLDQPYKTISEKGLTKVVHFSLNNEATNYYQFPTNATVNFTSFLIDNKLFRAFTTSKKFVIRVYDLMTGKVLKETEILRGQFNPMVFTRHGKKNEVYNNESLTTTMKLSQICEPSLSLVKDGQSYGILWGTFYDENQVAGPSMLNPAGVITAIAFNAVLQSMEKPGISRYIYYACDTKDLTFQSSDTVSSAIRIRKSIDLYELELERKKIRIDFKNYIAYKEGVLATYYLRKEDVFRLVRFD